MAAMTVYNAFSLPRVAAPKAPTTVVPATVPQHKPFASQRRMQSMAFTPAMDGLDFSGARRLSFVRPDVPPVSDARSQDKQTRDSETTAEASFKARPQFRSALEQVSFVTNNKLWDAREHVKGVQRSSRPKLGIFGL